MKSPQIRPLGSGSPSARPAAVGNENSVVRQMLLLVAMLVEGGLAIFPRVPLTLLLFAAGFALVMMRGGPRRETWLLYLIPIAVLFEGLLFHADMTAESLASRFANFCGAIFLVDLYLREAPDRFLRELFPILKWMAIQAVLTSLLAYGANGLFRPIDIGEYQYMTIGLVFNYHMMATDVVMKPDGFFFERGVLQLFLNLYLYISLYVVKSKYQTALAVASVISTWSSAGVIVMIFIFGWGVLKQFSSFNMAVIVRTFVLALVLGAPLGYFAYENLSEKFTGGESSSFKARQFDFAAGMEILSENPVVGIGFSPEVFAELFLQKTHLRSLDMGANVAERGLSNGIIRLLLTLGIPMGVLFLWGLFRSVLFPDPFLVGGLLFLSLLSEPIAFCPFLLMVMFSGLTKRHGVGAGRGRPASGLPRLERGIGRRSPSRPGSDALRPDSGGDTG